jgi:hypothetical protein
MATRWAAQGAAFGLVVAVVAAAATGATAREWALGVPASMLMCGGFASVLVGRTRWAHDPALREPGVWPPMLAGIVLIVVGAVLVTAMSG